MNFHPWDGLAAGAAGVLAMTLVMRSLVLARLTQLRFPMVLGSWIFRTPGLARAAGLAVHVIAGVVFGLAYAALWAWWSISVGWASGLWIGAVVGAVHGIFAMVAMPLMSARHPRAVEPYPAPRLALKRQRALVGRESRPSVQRALYGDGPRVVRLPEAFGFGGRAFGRFTPAAMIAAHVVYGAVAGLVLGLLS